MKNIQYLVDNNIINNRSKSIKENKNIIIKIRAREFTSGTFNNILNDLLKINSLNNLPEIVVLKFNEIIFRDKSVQIMFECLIYYVCKNFKFKFKFEIKHYKVDNKFYSLNIKNSLLDKYNNVFFDKKTYIEEFDKININPDYFRKIIKDDNENCLSILLSELTIFLKKYNFSNNDKEKIADMIVELAGNANEHSLSDCLIDLTIDNTVTNRNKHHNCLGVDIVVIGFSPILLGDGIKKILTTNTISENSIPFKKDLNKAYQLHKKYFDDYYTFDDFCNISAFQWRFSGREKPIDKNGGTGLTKVIESLINASEANNCYVYSGNKVIFFKKDLIGIEYVDDNKGFNVGFNKEGSYHSNIPDKLCIGTSDFFLHGTLYNLTFIFPKNNGGF